MIKRLKEFFEKEFEQEAPRSRLQRVKYAIILGVIGAFAYALVSAVVNVVSYPNMHLVVNWANAVTTWIAITLALAVAGFIVGWPTEEVKAIVGGGVMLTFVLLLVNTIAYLVVKGDKGSYFQVLIASLPMVGVCVLAALGLRQAINRIDAASKEDDLPRRRSQFVKLVGIIVVLGIMGGFLARFDRTALTMLTTLNARLQSTDTSTYSKVQFPKDVLQEVQSHYGEEYGLYVRSATGSVGALDVTIRFNSGYTITCQIPSDTNTYVVINSCAEGTRIR